MAVARMLKITVIGHRPATDEVLRDLQRAGVVEITALQASEGFPEGLAPHTLSDLEGDMLRDTQEQVADAQFIRDFLARFHESDVRLGMFVSEKVHIDEDSFLAIDSREDLGSIYRECVDLADRLATAERERERSSALIEALEPWRELPLPVADWHGTEHVVMMTGTVPERRCGAIRQTLRDAVDEVTVAELGPRGERQAWVVMAHRDRESQVRETLTLTEFEETDFPGLSGLPVDEIRIAQEHIARAERDVEECSARARVLAEEHYASSVALVQALLSRRDSVDVRTRFGTTSATFVLEGWMPERGKHALESALAPHQGSVDVTLRPPRRDESPPVELANPGFVRPFELLTDLYGRPTYWNLDPTPWLAGFFFLFFGMCIGDVGYGVTLILAALGIKRFLDVAPGVKRFMDLLVAGGVASIIVGAATRSYFALETEALPSFLRYEALVELPEEIVNLLAVSVAMGIVHVILGIGLRVRALLREGDWESAVFDEMTNVGLLVAVALALVFPPLPVLAIALGVVVLLKGRVFLAPLAASEVPAWDKGLGWVWVALAVAAPFMLAAGVGGAVFWWLLAALSAVGLVVSRSVRAGIRGLLMGLLGVYGLSGYISDFLSYTRLAALGLAGFLVGMVMNILAGLVGSGGGIWYLAAAAVFVIGHAFNLIINVLGAFVHPTRLQFVEFFSKFYEAGGRNFAPFAMRTKSLVLRPAERQEGGAG